MNNLIKLAKVFSDKNRLNIMAMLLRDKELCVCEISDTLELSQPLVSRHLKQMKEADVLDSRQEGKWVIYSLNKNPSALLMCCIKELSNEIEDLPKLVTCNIK